MTHHMSHQIIYTADFSALFLIFGSVFGFLPAVAAGLAAVWYGILIFDRFFTK